MVKILAGDFNCIESDRDKFGGKFTSVNELKELRKNVRVVDIWRKLHGSLLQCTWFNASKTIGSRLDKFFIPQDLVPTVISCEILPSVLSDHDSVNLVFDVKGFSSHGPGVWQLNLELLKDYRFCELIKATITEHVEYQHCFPSLHEWWGFLKISSRDIAQDFGKSKQRKINYDKVTATNLLIKAKRDLLAGDDSARIRIDRLESELQAPNFVNQESLKIRSRAQWLEEGEKPTKYFFALKSTRRDKNSIKVVYNSGGDKVSSQSEIENSIHEVIFLLYEVIFL